LTRRRRMPELRKRCIQIRRQLKTRHVIIDTPNKKAKLYASARASTFNRLGSVDDNPDVSARDLGMAFFGRRRPARVSRGRREKFRTRTQVVFGVAICCFGDLFFDLADRQQSRSIYCPLRSSVGSAIWQLLWLSRITKGKPARTKQQASVIPDNR
jgi:hypothetical protein